MTNIVVESKPFVMNQTVSVFENGALVSQLKVSQNSLVDTVYALANQYNCNTVEIKGSKAYIEKYAKDLKAKSSMLTVNMVK